MKQLLLFIAVSIFTTTYAQNRFIIVLNKPSENRGKNIMEAFAARASVREFSSEELSIQNISDLLWAANGCKPSR
jgi:hypothetical protein